MRELSDDAIDRAVAALDRFRQVAEVHDAPITAVATSAVREAENRDLLIHRAWDEARVLVNVISGVEEARLIHLGVLQAVPVFEKRLLLCDIGGGSTELLVGQRGEVLASRSLKLGAIRLTRRFFDGNLTHPGALDACRRFVRSTIAPFAREVRQARGGGGGRLLGHDRQPRRDGGAARHRHPASLGQQPRAHHRAAGRAGEGAGRRPRRQGPSRAARARRQPGRHHPRRRRDPRAGGARARHPRADRVRLRAPRGRAARHVAAPPRRLAPPPVRPPPSERPRPRRADGRRPAALGPGRAPRARAVRRDRASGTGSATTPGRSSRRPRCCATSGCSCPTPSTTSTATT